MDIEYLLFLQNMREATGSFLSPIMDWLTKFSISFWTMALVLMLYWVCDRKAGRRALFGVGLGYLINGFLKLTCCINRPWIRDARIQPYGDSKVAATGYSFPSGHSANATFRYGSVALWARKRNKWIAGILFVLIPLTMFSRNYLGVHTPQDVLVGCASAFVMLGIGSFLENWSDKDPDKRDLYILAGGILVCIACVAYYLLKPYPMTYLADGSLLVDPKAMLPDSFEGIGFISAYVICRYFERRGYDFEAALPWKDRFVVGTICLLPAIWWYNNIVSIVASVANKCVGKFFFTAGIVVYAMIIVPRIMKLYEKKFYHKEKK